MVLSTCYKNIVFYWYLVTYIILINYITIMQYVASALGIAVESPQRPFGSEDLQRKARPFSSNAQIILDFLLQGNEKTLLEPNAYTHV